MAPGDELGRFRLEGAMADGSWRARESRSGAPMRVRIVDPFSDDAFLAGGRALLALEDPALLPVADVGVEPDGTAWVAEVWQPGETLAERVARVGPLPSDHLLAVAEGLFAGLAAAHAKGVRDGAITPERLKILGEPPHTVLLVQPGLGALITDLVPDPDFAPPEGSAPTVAADLFGAAATLCFAALGSSVPSGQALDLAAPRLPTNLLDALRQSLDPDPHDRPHSVEPLKRAVQAMRSRGGLIQPPAEGGRGREPRALVSAGRPPSAPPPRVDPSADTAPPTNEIEVAAGLTQPAERRIFEATLAHSESPHFDFSADATLPPEPELDLATLTLPAAPPIPEQRRAPASMPPGPERALAESAPVPEVDPFVVPGRAATRTRPAPAAPTPPAAPSRAPLFAAGAVLLLGVGAVVGWSTLREPRGSVAVPVDAGVATVAPDTTLAPAAAPSEPDRDTYVRVAVEDGPARFVQVATGTVLCEGVEMCNVPIDVATRVERAGHRSVVLSGDDLYDRRGGRWRIRLYRGR